MVRRFCAERRELLIKGNNNPIGWDVVRGSYADVAVINGLFCKYSSVL